MTTETYRQRKVRLSRSKASRKKQLREERKERNSEALQERRPEMRLSRHDIKRHAHVQAIAIREKCERQLLRAGFYLDGDDLVLTDDFWPATLRTAVPVDRDQDDEIGQAPEETIDLSDDALLALSDDEIFAEFAEIGQGCRIYAMT